MIELIKLQDKFILVSDEQPIDYYLDDTNTIREVVTDDEEYWSVRKEYKKIIAGITELPSIDFSLLSEADCKTVRYVDVEKLAEEYSQKTNKGHYNDLYPNCDQTLGKVTVDDFISGFKTAQSLNNKMFSLEDITKAIDFGVHVEAGNIYIDYKKYSTCENQFIQSLQQTSWNVEVNELNQIIKIK